MHRSTSPTPAMDDLQLPHTPRRVSYFYDPDVGGFAYPYQHPMKPHRMRMAHALIGSYGMLGRMQVVRPRRANELDLTRFHTDEYIQFLKTITAENYMEWTANKKFCQTDDCPPWDGLFDFATLTAGSSISAAHSLVTGHSDIAIAWAGGLHHAKRTEASGFCYVNDIVLGILELLRVHARVLYVDIDIHHGDGVEEAFYTTDRVMTCSFHKFGDFFPGTGTVSDIGKGRGKGYAVNFPCRDGFTDEKFVEYFKAVVGKIMEWFRPGAVVLQGGADSLAGDKLGVFNLSMHGHAACAAYVRTFNVPLMMVGGGGYTVKNVARTWTYETAVAIGCQTQISPDLPNNEYLEWFGPRYKLEVLRNNMEDYNSSEYLEATKEKIFENLRGLPHAPSAPMARNSEGAERKVWKGDDWSDEDSDIDDLDKRISERLRDKHTKGVEDALSETESQDEQEDLDEHPAAPDRMTFRTRSMPRKHKYSERFTPSSSRSRSFDDEEEYEEEERVPRFAPRKRLRTFFGGGPQAFVDPRLQDMLKEELERVQEKERRREGRESEREARNRVLKEVIEEDLKEVSSLGKERERGRGRERSISAAKKVEKAEVEEEEEEEEDVDIDEEEEREAERKKREEDEDEEEEEDEDEEQQLRLKPTFHPSYIAGRKGSREKDEEEEHDDQDDQEGEDREEEDHDEHQDNEDHDEQDERGEHEDEDMAEIEVEDGEEEEAEEEKEAEVDVEMEMDDDDEVDAQGEGEEGEEGEGSAVPPAPTTAAVEDRDDSELSEEEEEAADHPLGEVDGDQEGGQDEEAELEDDDGHESADEGEDREHGHDDRDRPEPENEAEDEIEVDADAAEVEPEPIEQAPSPESSEPSTVSLSRSPSGSPPMTGAQSGYEMEDGEVEDESEQRGRDTERKDLRLEDLAEAARAKDAP